MQSGSHRERNICWKFLRNGLHEDHFEVVRRRMIPKRYRIAPLQAARVKIKVEPCASTLRSCINLWVLFSFYCKSGKISFDSDIISYKSKIKKEKTNGKFQRK